MTDLPPEETGNRPLTVREARQLLSGKQQRKVGLDRNTWVALLSLLLTLIGVVAALAVFTFKTRAEAAEDHAQIKAAIPASITAHTTDKDAHPDKAKATELKEVQDTLHRLDKKISIMGDRMGAGRAMRRVDDDSE